MRGRCYQARHRCKRKQALSVAANKETNSEAAESFSFSDDFDEINRHYRKQRWSDGLPIVPPTAERVDRMLKAAGRPRDEQIAKVAPMFGVATVERVAINAVMAGCDPEYMPVLIAAVEAIAAEEFNLQAMQATTNPAATWVIVTGPLAKTLEINHSFNCLGEGAWANSTIGRAMRLILRNIGGALPGDMCRSTHGQPAKIGMCCGENVADSPWDSFHHERGFTDEQSAVTVVGVEGTINMNTHTKNGDELLAAFAETMVHPPSNEYTHGGEPWLVIGPEHAHIFDKAGLSKRDVQYRIWEQTKIPAHHMTGKDLERTRASRADELGEISDDAMIPIARRPEDIIIFVAGGPGTHSIYVPCFGNSRAVSRLIALPH